MDRITEATAVIKAPKQDIVDKKMEIFYNPVMMLNRDISILVLSSLQNTAPSAQNPEPSSQASVRSSQSAVPSSQPTEHSPLSAVRRPLIIALPLAGSGIRGIRFLKEVPENLIKEIHFNDKKENYVSYNKKMMTLNKFEQKDLDKVFVHNKDASLFLIEHKPFDYIDIDPFGTPNPFLDSAIRSLRSEGILAVTATDTSALSGTYPNACRRKYWAIPLRNELMHEIGLRILIRKVQLMGTNQQRALVPILSYSKDHYMRIFFRFDKGKENMDAVLDKHEFYFPDGKQNADSQTTGYGPMWMGPLNDSEFLEKVKIESEKNEHVSKRAKKLIESLVDESKIPEFGFIDIHNLAKNASGEIPKFEHIILALRKKGFKASRVHFRDTAIKTNAKRSDVEKILKQKELTKYLS